MPAGTISGKLNLNGAGWSSAVDKAKREITSLQEKTAELGHRVPSEMQAASASIRLIEGDMTRNVRAVERFITTIPGVGKALQAAFPLVGGIALAGIIFKIGDEAAKAIQKVNGAGKEIDQAFGQLNLSARTANDTLRITNDRLENEIAKLEGKPQNNLALSIDEARLAADKMAESLDRDNQKVKQLLEQNAVPWWAGFLGKAGTGVVSDSLNAQNQGMSDLANRAAIARGEGNTAEADRLTAQIDSQRRKALADNQREIAARAASQNQPGGLNQGANLSALYGQQALLYGQVDAQQQQARNLTDEKRKQADEEAKAQQEAAKRAAAAMKQAQMQIVEQWRNALDQDKALAEVSLDQEAAYWLYRAQAATKGSLSYKAAIDEANKDIARINADTARQRKELEKRNDEFDQTGSSIAPSSMDLTRGDNSEMKANGQGAIEYLRNLNQVIALQRQNADAIAEAGIRMGLMTGQMSKLDAAQASAALHAREYKDQVDAINDALAKTELLPDGFEKLQRKAGLNDQLNQVNGARQVQILDDQQNVSSNTIPGATRDALNQMVQSWDDLAANLKQLIPQTMNSLNDDIVAAMTGHGKRSDFAHTFTQAGQGVLSASLQKVEGIGLKALGLGKADGSKQNPFYTIAAAGQGAPAELNTTNPTVSAGIDLAKLVPGGSFIQPFMKGLSSFLPHFAEGGPVEAGQAIWTGEKGPEPFIPKSAGTMIPNKMLGGGDVHHHYNVDARGSNDPAAVHAAVMRAAPHIATAAVHAQHQRTMRTPRGR